ELTDNRIDKIIWNIDGKLVPRHEIRNLTEDLFYSLQNFFLYRLILGLHSWREFRQEIFLLSRQLARNDNVQCHEKVTPCRTAPLGNTTALDAECRSGLRARRNRQPLFAAVENGDRDLGSQSSLREADGNMAIQIMFAAFEE